MRKITLLLLVLSLMSWAKTASAEASKEAQIQQIDRHIRVVKQRVQELEALLTSLVENQTNFAGYGIPRGGDDVARVRQELYRARAEYGELAARKLYLTHSQKVQKSAAPKSNSSVEAVDPTPTMNPQDCTHGVVKMGDKWHCVLKQSVNEISPAEMKEEVAEVPKDGGCDLGTFDVDGETYCLGSEPGGPLRAKMSLEFLGTLMKDDPDMVKEEAPVTDDVYQQLRFQ